MSKAFIKILAVLACGYAYSPLALNAQEAGVLEENLLGLREVQEEFRQRVERTSGEVRTTEVLSLLSIQLKLAEAICLNGESKEALRILSSVDETLPNIDVLELTARCHGATK